MEKIDKELDCVNFLYSVRQLRAVVFSLMSTHQQMLLMFSQDALLKIEDPDIREEKVQTKFLEELPRLEANETAVKDYEQRIEELMQDLKGKKLTDQEINSLHYIINK